MLLALDIGNSQTSYGIFNSDGKLLHHWRSETKPSRTSDEFASFLFPLLEHAGLKEAKWEGIAICSVVPPVDQSFENFATQFLKLKPFRVTHQCDLGFTFNVDVPHEVGADRLANAAYAVKHLKLPAIVVDLGTATTFDVISKNRVYEGGIILPGVQMGLDSLSTKTALLPRVNANFPPSVVGKNTMTCIQSGVLFGYLEAINGLLERLLVEFPNSDVVLTGGLAPLFIKQLKVSARLLSDLTLEGTEILYRRNHRSQ